MAIDGGTARRRRRWLRAAPVAALATVVLACAGPTSAGDPPPATTRASGAVITESGVLVSVLARQGPITWVRTPCWNTVAIRSGRPVEPRPDVVLDPGHGGPEEGAVGPNGLREREVNRAVTDQVAARLNDGTDYYGVLRYTQGVPSVILESAFVTSAPEADLLAGDDARRTEADAIVRAIEADLAEPIPVDAGPEPGYRPFPDSPPPDAEGCIDPSLEG